MQYALYDNLGNYCGVASSQSAADRILVLGGGWKPVNVSEQKCSQCEGPTVHVYKDRIQDLYECLKCREETIISSPHATAIHRQQHRKHKELIL